MQDYVEDESNVNSTETWAESYYHVAARAQDGAHPGALKHGRLRNFVFDQGFHIAFAVQSECRVGSGSTDNTSETVQC